LKGCLHVDEIVYATEQDLGLISFKLDVRIVGEMSTGKRISQDARTVREKVNCIFNGQDHRFPSSLRKLQTKRIKKSLGLNPL
jgi:hypothetical protein